MRKECTTCEGTGFADCHHLRGGAEHCSDCRGSLLRECHRCSGTGFVTRALRPAAPLLSALPAPQPGLFGALERWFAGLRA